MRPRRDARCGASSSTTRAENILSKTLGVLIDTHGQIDVKWDNWNVTPVKVYCLVDNQTSTDGGFIHGRCFALENVDMYNSLLKQFWIVRLPPSTSSSTEKPSLDSICRLHVGDHVECELLDMS